MQKDSSEKRIVTADTRVYQQRYMKEDREGGGEKEGYREKERERERKTKTKTKRKGKSKEKEREKERKISKDR